MESGRKSELERDFLTQNECVRVCARARVRVCLSPAGARSACARAAAWVRPRGRRGDPADPVGTPDITPSPPHRGPPTAPSAAALAVSLRALRREGMRRGPCAAQRQPARPVPAVLRVNNGCLWHRRRRRSRRRHGSLTRRTHARTHAQTYTHTHKNIHTHQKKISTGPPVAPSDLGSRLAT